MAVDPVLEQLKKLDERMTRIERHMQWDLAITVARFVIIAIPIVLAFIYVPKFVREYFPQAQSFVVELQQGARFLQKLGTPGTTK